ncbi:MAG: hypothetical protein ABI683_13355 [Ginsengibacter sp.]
MTAVNIILLLLTTVALISYSFNFLSSASKRKKENLCSRLSKEGTLHNLIFCSQEILQNKIIGVDGIHRKIMVLEKNKKNYNSEIISLDEVENCELITTRRMQGTHSLNRVDAEKNIDAVELQLEFKNNSRTAAIIFFDSSVNSLRELDILKAKARYWNIMFSKMLTRSRIEVRA